MKISSVASALFLAAAVGGVHAQAASSAPASGPAPMQQQVVLPQDTLIQVTPVEEITSKHMHEGDAQMLQTAADVAQDGVVVIPRGSSVKATVTWRTGKGIVGKSAKFELTFNSVTVRGKEYALKGKHRQEGRGNTVGALLGSAIITGHSAVIVSGQILTAFTAQPIPAETPVQQVVQGQTAAGSTQSQPARAADASSGVKCVTCQ